MSKLTKLEIRREGWGDDIRRPLIGNVTFKGVKTETTIVLNEELSRKIVEICADELKSAAHAISQEMMANIVEPDSKPLIGDA